MSTKIMWILNITPDSFFDWWKYDSLPDAKKQIKKMLKSNVDIIDVWWFSSRPNSVMPSVKEELSRIIPILDYLDTLNIDFSVDTCRSKVVEKIIKYKNLKYINDISWLEDEKILDLIKNTEIWYVLMHIKWTPENMQNNPSYKDVVSEINDFFREKLKILKKKKIKNIVIDPWFWFWKTVENNYEILRNLDKFKKFWYPVLCWLSRKSMIYKPLWVSQSDVLNETIALNLLAINKWADIIRVHDVEKHTWIVKLWEYLKPEIDSYKMALDNIFRLEVIRDYSLEKAKDSLEKLWHPENNYKIIHIAWTNWKWSVSKMVFEVLKKAWKKVWVFTSPHLFEIRERFETEKWLISKKDFVKVLNKVISTRNDLSYFEKCTLIALEYFKEKKCEYVVLETWCGGRLDTTNVVTPVITCITSIWLDHIDLLGDTLEKISFEKSWIIKSNIPVVLNFENDVIENTAKEKNSEIIWADKKIKTNLLWEYQEKNASLAFEICKYLWIEEKNILKWLKSVHHRWRLEMIRDNVLVDGAHNEQWLKELKSFVDKNLEKKFKKVNYCFSLKKWKDIKLVTDIFWDDKNYILLDIKSELLEDVKKYKWEYVLATKKEIMKNAKENKKELYVIFGSLYMIWEFLKKQR